MTPVYLPFIFSDRDKKVSEIRMKRTRNRNKQANYLALNNFNNSTTNARVDVYPKYSRNYYSDRSFRDFRDKRTKYSVTIRTQKYLYKSISLLKKLKRRDYIQLCIV